MVRLPRQGPAEGPRRARAGPLEGPLMEKYRHLPEKIMCNSTRNVRLTRSFCPLVVGIHQGFFWLT